MIFFFSVNKLFLKNRSLLRAVKCQTQVMDGVSCMWEHTLHLFITAVKA